MVDALLEFYAEGEVHPGGARIAERAGISERSLFRHFDDLEELAAAAIERHAARVAPLFAAPPAGADRSERIALLVDQRLRLHDGVMAVARAGAYVAARSPTVAAALDGRRRYLRRQALEHLAPDLDGLEGSTRVEVEHAVDAATSLEAVEYLRGITGLSPAAAGATMARLLGAVLAASQVSERT